MGDELVRLALPVPMRSYRERTGLPCPEDQPLRWPAGLSTRWAQRCRAQPELPWALWTVLDALPQLVAGDLELCTTRGVRRLVGTIGGMQLRLFDRGGRTLGVVLDGSGVFTPGPSMEDLARDAPSAASVLSKEVARAARWIAADEALGLRMLLGPLSRSLYGKQSQRRQVTGYLDGEFCLTRGGWWRLGYLSQQAVGVVERRRHVALQRMSRGGAEVAARGRRRKHLQATQALALQMWQEEDLVPLGVEVSAVGGAIGQRYGMRADALLVDRASTRLVWVEVLRRPETRMPALRRESYRRKRELMSEVAAAFEVEVEWRLFEPNGSWERWRVGDGPGVEPAQVVIARS